jgi:deazaflavin-dependent oxidoreductase (nitroreductase family)
MSWLDPHHETENCYLTTVGRRSGRPHEVEIWFGVLPQGGGDTLYLISGNGPSADWFRNALASGTATVRIDGETHDGAAREVTDADERRAVGDLMGEKYPWDGDPSIGLTFQAWCYEVPVLAISDWRDAQ